MYPKRRNRPATLSLLTACSGAAVLAGLAGLCIFGLHATSAADPAPTPDAKPTPDAQVGKALDAENLPYNVSPKGNYRVTLDFTDDKRSQLVLINSATDTFRGDNWRDVYSTAFTVKGHLTQEQANDLLAENGSAILGAWCTGFDNGETQVYYQIIVPADASAAELHHAISYAGSTADDMEKKITNKDDN